MFELNGKPISIDYLKQKAEEFGMSYEDFLNDSLSTGNLVQKGGDKTMAGVGVLRKEFLPGQTQQTTFDPSSVLTTALEADDEVEEETFSLSDLRKNIVSRQDGNISSINEVKILKGRVEEDKQKRFLDFRLKYKTDNPDEVVSNFYGKDVFSEPVDPGRTGGRVYFLPDEKIGGGKKLEGFLLEDYDFRNTNTLEGARDFYLNQKSNEISIDFEKKYGENVYNTITTQGENYISLEDMDIVNLRKEGKKDEADKLAKDRGYVPLLDENNNITNWIPKAIEDDAQNRAESTDRDVLEDQLKQSFYKLLAARDLAYENSTEDTPLTRHTLADVSFGKSLVHKIRDAFGDDKSLDDVMAKIEQSYKGDLIAGLNKIPSKTATAKAFNNALDEFVVLNRALAINADLTKIDEQNFVREIFDATNDRVAETLTSLLEANGYESDPNSIKRAGSDWNKALGIKADWQLRDVLEGGRDVAAHLVPLAASVYLTKKLPVNLGVTKLGQKTAKVKSLNQFINGQANVIGRYVKKHGPQSRAFRSAVDLTMGGIKETLILGMADVPANRLFGADPFVYNEKTGEFTPTFPFALGFGNAAAAKILKRLNTTDNFFTPALATIERSKTAQSILQMNIGATTGTATMFFAEEVTKGVDNWKNLGYESEEDMKQDHGFKNLVETYIGMLMFQSVSPSMKQNSLAKLASGMRSDILKYTTGLTPRSRKAMKLFGIETNEKGEFNLQEVKNKKSQKQYEISRDKKLDKKTKREKIQEIENAAEELIFHNELKLAKELAKKEGKYREYLNKTFVLANKLKTGDKPTSEDIQRFAELSPVELKFLKLKFGVTENSDFSRMLDNKYEVYKDIISRVDQAYITKDRPGIIQGRMFEGISPEARNKQIQLLLEQAEFAGEITRLKLEAEKKPHLKEINAEKIKDIKEKQKLNAQDVIKNEQLYDKILKEKFETEVQFSKLMTKELGAGFNLVGENAFVAMGGTKGSEGFFNRKTNQVYINRDRALEVRQLGTPLHEVTHAILRNSLKESYIDDQGVERTRVSKEGMTKINQFLNQLTSKERAAVEKRMDQEYKYERNSKGDFILKNGKKILRPENQYAEEYLTAFGDVLKNKEVIETPDLASRISNFFTPIMRQAGFKNMQVTAENGRGLYNMIKAIQKSSETGIIDKDVLNIAKTSKVITGKALAESRTITEGMKEASTDIDRIYKEKSVGGYNEIIDRIKGKKEVIDPITGEKTIKQGKDFIKQYTEIYEGHANYPERKRDLYDAMAYDPTYGVLGSIMKYDASKGTTMAEHILGRLKRGKHIDVANIILGKDAQRQFTKNLDAAEIKEVEAKQLTAEELTDISLAKEKIQQAPNLRKSLVKGEEKGINQELIDKVEATVVKTFGTKIPNPEAKGFRKSIENSYKTELKKPIADLMGKGPEYEVFLRDNFDAIMKYVDKSFFVQMERLTPRKDRIFTEVEIESMSTKQTDKAIAEGRVPKNTNRNAGNTLWKFKKPAPAQFLKFYTGAGLGSTKGTRKDRLAEVIGIELAKDFTSEILSRPEVAAKIKQISLLELEKSIEGTGKTSPKIAEAKKIIFDNYTERVAAQIGRDPNLAFSYTKEQFKQEVKELRDFFNKTELSFGEIYDVKTQKPLVKRSDGKEFNELAYNHVLEGYKNNLLDINVTRYQNKILETTGKKIKKGTAYEYYTENNINKQIKGNKNVKVTSEVSEKAIQLPPQGIFKGGKVPMPDFMLEMYNNTLSWELKYKDARTPKNSAGFIDYTQAYKDITAGKEFKLTDRKSPRKNATEEAIFVESVKEAILNGVPKVEKVLRDRGVLKEGENFTSTTKVPKEVYALLRGNENAKMSSSKQTVNGDWVAADYNKKGVFNFQMATKGAFFLGSDPLGIIKELGGTKLEGNFPLMTRVYGTSYKNKAGETMGYTYKLVGEAIISPKNITSESNFNLDSPNSVKQMINTKSAKRLKSIAESEASAFKQNFLKFQAQKQKGREFVKSILESKTNTELIEKIKIVDKALENAQNPNKKSRGMSTFDFDETLIDKGKNFIVATKGKDVVRISSGKWPVDGPKYAEQGYKFDFKDFVNVRGGIEGPLLQKMRNQIKKFGPENVFVLTARPAESAPAIQAWLKSKNINIKLENITGLGNSTGEAKAMWMLEKFSEGYNDMYFVDDAISNVKAVKEVLNQLDIKSKVQQVYSKTNINKEINDIMQYSLGIKSSKKFSKAEGKVRGKDAKRRRFFLPDSAADFELLIEPLYGKGKKGIENKKWFERNVIDQFEKGIDSYNTARQTAKNDYMSLRKQNKDIVKQLPKEVEGTSFTHDMAMRIYLWNKAGYTIPDLAKTTEAKLVEYIKNNPALRSYAEQFGKITKQEKGLKEPSNDWWAETMAGEVTNVDRGVSRKQYLNNFINIKNEVFSEKNLNKMESKLGSNWRESMEDILDRMETGRTRSLTLDRGSSMMMNYLNGGVGTIMNFNTRSALLQTISTINFLNMRENNPVAAAMAMANTKQFVKDFMFIMNSDMLKQRRDGLAINVTEAELASAAATSKNPINSMIAKILKVGYTPTKLADSFAISFGGATYYRNRIKMYEKQGLTTREAEKKAFIDFQKLSERTQQSSRPDLLSKQQTSLVGRIILPFANTPMQMNRRGMKDILDIYKGRYEGVGELSEKMGRVTYYMGAQVAIFAGLQSALFAMMLNDEDVSEDKIIKTKEYALNTTSDSFLRGMGIKGAIVSGFKNATIKYMEQSKKGFTADYSEVGEALLNISPPIGSKFGRLDAAGERLKWAKIKKQQPGLEFGNPYLEAGLLTIESITNAPVYSPYQNALNIQHALSNDYENWQRAHMLLGFSPYNVGIEKDKKEEKKVTPRVLKRQVLEREVLKRSIIK